MSKSFIEGIGDEVLVCCGAFITLVAGAYTASRYLPSDGNNYSESTMASVGPGSGRAVAYNSEICPICISPHRLAVETNCGHKFCGLCIKSYLNNRPGRELFFTSGSLSCPMCRQAINLLLIGFSREDMANGDQAERREVEAAVYEYNVRFGSGPRSWMTYIRDCPVLVRHMLAEFFSFGGLVWLFRVRVLSCFAVAVMYLLMPLDIIPEALFGFFGFLDDVVIVFLCAIYLSIIYRRFLLNRANGAEM